MDTDQYCLYIAIALPIFVVVVLVLLKLKKHCCPDNKQLLRINITNASNPSATNTILYRPGQPVQLQITNPPSTAPVLSEQQYVTHPYVSSCNSLYGYVPEDRRIYVPSESCPLAVDSLDFQQRCSFDNPQRPADFQAAENIDTSSWEFTGRRRSLENHVYEEIEFEGK